MEVKLPMFEVVSIASQPSEEIPYGVMMIGAPKVWAVGKKGKGVNVAILDTGVDGNHPDINLAGQVDFTGDGVGDKQGHGTHVAGSIGANGKIKGVAPECNLYDVKVLADSGYGEFDWIVRGVYWCIQNKMDVVNMSLGAAVSDQRIAKAVKDAEAAGILVIAAAGNSNDKINYPAGYNEVVAVTAVDIDKRRANFSCFGQQAEIAAAGSSVFSTHLNSGYANLCGTSMASPHVAGAAALLIEACRLRNIPVTPQFLRSYMRLRCHDLGTPGWDPQHGFGLFTFGECVDLFFKADQRVYAKNGQDVVGVDIPIIMNDIMMISSRDLDNGLEDADMCIEFDTETKTVRIKNF